VDEIHRFNKAQQDAFLPYVEDGTVVLIGATTENPSFEVIAPLLSRCRVYRLERLEPADLVALMRRALGDSEHGLGGSDVEFPEELLEALAVQCQGDARAALNALELTVRAAVDDPPRPITRELLSDALQKTALYYDRAGEEHFNLISALHKSMRNSDPDASLYWLGRMLASGEDPLYIARRIVRFASEDVGLADPRALTLAVGAKDAVHLIGLPEGELALAEAAVYCATAPKSNALYRAWSRVKRAIDEGATDPVPLQLRNAPTGLMQREGYGKGYRYAHDDPDAVTSLDCLPDRLRGRRFYEPTSRGFERTLAERLQLWAEARRKRRQSDRGLP
jgi:putative ATPase